MHEDRVCSRVLMCTCIVLSACLWNSILCMGCCAFFCATVYNVQVICNKAEEQDLPEEKVPERVRKADGGFRQLQAQLLAAESATHEGVARFYLDGTEGDARAAKQRLRAFPCLSLPASVIGNLHQVNSLRSSQVSSFALCPI